MLAEFFSLNLNLSDLFQYFGSGSQYLGFIINKITQRSITDETSYLIKWHQNMTSTIDKIMIRKKHHAFRRYIEMAKWSIL